MIRHSAATERNPQVDERVAPQDAAVATKRAHSVKEDNLTFFGRALKALGGGEMAVGLVGQRDLVGVSLRRAQAVLRWDLRPSLWSHAFVVCGTAPKTSDVPIREVVMRTRTGAFPDPADNAVTHGTLGQYADERVDANVALYSVRLTKRDRDALRERVEDPNLDRLRYDLWQSLGIWQTYFWSAGAAPNPLREGFPIPASSFVEYCYEAIRLDLSPGASERNSAPEHLWNGAVWWHEELKKVKRPAKGFSLVRDPYCTLLDPEELRIPHPISAG
jgi:hypothetical protein